jgi:hypothetical protein
MQAAYPASLNFFYEFSKLLPKFFIDFCVIFIHQYKYFKVKLLLNLASQFQTVGLKSKLKNEETPSVDGVD